MPSHAEKACIFWFDNVQYLQVLQDTPLILLWRKAFQWLVCFLIGVYAGIFTHFIFQSVFVNTVSVVVLPCLFILFWRMHAQAEQEMAMLTEATDQLIAWNTEGTTQRRKCMEYINTQSP